MIGSVQKSTELSQALRDLTGEAGGSCGPCGCTTPTLRGVRRVALEVERAPAARDPRDGDGAHSENGGSRA